MALAVSSATAVTALGTNELVELASGRNLMKEASVSLTGSEDAYSVTTTALSIASLLNPGGSGASSLKTAGTTFSEINHLATGARKTTEAARAASASAREAASGAREVAGAAKETSSTASNAERAAREIHHFPNGVGGPLKERLANAFRGGTYTERVLQEDTTFYRVWGGDAKEVGSFMSRTPQNGGLQSQLDLALNPQWGNTATNVTKVIVPKGTTIFEGTAAPVTIGGGLGTLPGGGSQVYIEAVNPNWFR